MTRSGSGPLAGLRSSSLAKWLVSLTIVRGIVFVSGGLFGLLFAMASNALPGGNPRIVTDLIIATLLGLALAAPVCWYFAVKGESGDRWTIGYALAWVLWFGCAFLLTLMF